MVENAVGYIKRNPLEMLAEEPGSLHPLPAHAPDCST